MSTIHIASPSGKRMQYDETQLRQLWEKDMLQEGTLYWREGMAQWRPVGECFRTQEAEGGLMPPPLLTRAYRYAKNPRGVTNLLLILLWFVLFFAVASLVSDLVQADLLSGPYTMAQAEDNDLRQQVLEFAQLLSFLVTGIVFLVWIHRANLNCHAFGAQGMRFTPGWCVGHYFIPIISLVRPYQTMREIWQVSKDPARWSSQRGFTLVGWWWGLWLFSYFFAQVSTITIRKAVTVEDLMSGTWFGVVGDVVFLANCAVLIALIRQIARNQEALTKMEVPAGTSLVEVYGLDKCACRDDFPSAGFGLTLGILGLISGFAPIVGQLLSLGGLLASVKARRRKRTTAATVGVVVGAIAFLLSLAWLALFVLILTSEQAGGVSP